MTVTVSVIAVGATVGAERPGDGVTVEMLVTVSVAVGGGARLEVVGSSETMNLVPLRVTSDTVTVLEPSSTRVMV